MEPENPFCGSQKQWTINYCDLAILLDLCTVYYKVFAFFYNWKEDMSCSNMGVLCNMHISLFATDSANWSAHYSTFSSMIHKSTYLSLINSTQEIIKIN